MDDIKKLDYNTKMQNAFDRIDAVINMLDSVKAELDDINADSCFKVVNTKIANIKNEYSHIISMTTQRLKNLKNK